MPSFTAPKSDFDAPNPLYNFITSPLTFIAREAYHFSLVLRRKPTVNASSIRIVCISDTHTLKTDIPDGDLLIHAGDLTNAGTIQDIQEQLNWLNTLPHPHKLAIAGNHDAYLDPRSRSTLAAADSKGELNWGQIHYLQHRPIALSFPGSNGRKLNIYGAPQIPACGGPEFAFQYKRGQDAWSDTIPMDTDVLVTHTPPRWHLDLPIGLGCEWLLKESWRVRPRLHVFGHIHAGRAKEPEVVWWDECQAAYERICARSASSRLDFVSLASWSDFVLLGIFGFKDVVWSLLWGGEAGGGLLVNAALMLEKTKRLDQKPQVVYI